MWRGEPVEISAKTDYERELEAVTDRLELALEATNTGVWEWDLDTDDLIWDETSEQLFGYEVGEFPGTYDGFIDRIHPDDVGDVERKIERAITESDQDYHAEYRLELPYGTVRWIQSRGIVESENGEPIRMVGIRTNITDRKQREQDLKRTKEELSRFAGVVSHDLRNPLNVAQNRLDLVDCDSEHLDHIVNAHDQMEQLIDDLLTLANEGETIGELQWVRFPELCESCWQTAGSAAGGIHIETNSSIRADPDRLQQLLENLFRNAVDHGDEEVTVTVGTFPEGVFVADDGPGIPEDQQSDIFKDGYTTRDTGTGYGLSIVESIVDAHGWDITADTSVDGGARLDITGVEMKDK
jgi:PAS domain S-box-containing protein